MHFAGATIGILGAGTMGGGLAQLAASFAHPVLVYDSVSSIRRQLPGRLEKAFSRTVSKGKMSEAEAKAALERIVIIDDLARLEPAHIVIEAVLEDLSAKQTVFSAVETVVSPETVLASNTSSIPITAIAAACERPENVVGMHFFNPAPVMPLVEIIGGMLSDAAVLEATAALAASWNKTVVRAQDTPGFIVNRVARPFYGEALRLLEEQIASAETIDWAMEHLGGFPMGPFELMDFIGNDINYAVTLNVFESFYYDARYRPSILQRRLIEAGRFGRKAGAGFYSYENGAPKKAPPVEDEALGRRIVERIVTMLINEAAEALNVGVATAADLDLAMTKGVRYPKGLLAWADEIGIDVVLERISALHDEYREERYRPCPLLRRMAREGRTFSSLKK